MTHEAIYGPVILAFFTSLFGWFLLKGFRSGTMEWGYYGLRVSGDRQTEPSRFWAATALNAVLFGLGLIGTVAMVFWPHGIGS
jgi:hypothetical protein